MKIILSIIFVTLCLLFAGCASVPEHKSEDMKEKMKERQLTEIELKFLGVWVGEHIDKGGIYKKRWIQERTNKGTYLIRLYEYLNNVLQTSSEEKGYWWVSGGKFYEIAPDLMNAPDVYTFKILNSDEIKFSSVKKEYSFIDRRKTNN